MKQRKYVWQWLSLVLVAALIILYFVRLPYFVQTPGEAKSMAGMIKVESGQKIHGKYSLVYIYLGQANVYQYLWARFDGNKYTTLVKEDEIKMPNENDQGYNLRQKNYMTSAQQSASFVAYKEAGKHPQVNEEGVLVLDVMPSMPSAKVLKSGDLIIGVQNHRVATFNQLDSYVKQKKLGDSFDLTIIRKKKVQQVRVTIAQFPKNLAGSGKKDGIGIYQADQMKVAVSPKVNFDIQNIGGPSAGLMMTLDIYDQLKSADLAKGRSIAGTGTIDMTGKVGPIGGIEEKIVGANQSGVSIFFAPVADHEYKTAKKTAKAIGSPMKVVPVKTFRDAVDYLQRTK
ncbi:MAG: SepM family pheromone-processing serine protease [Sporolactobacillus sp.]